MDVGRDEYIHYILSFACIWLFEKPKPVWVIRLLLETHCEETILLQIIQLLTETFPFNPSEV